MEWCWRIRLTRREMGPPELPCAAAVVAGNMRISAIAAVRVVELIVVPRSYPGRKPRRRILFARVAIGPADAPIWQPLCQSGMDRKNGKWLSRVVQKGPIVAAERRETGLDRCSEGSRLQGESKKGKRCGISADPVKPSLRGGAVPAAGLRHLSRCSGDARGHDELARNGQDAIVARVLKPLEEKELRHMLLPVHGLMGKGQGTLSRALGSHRKLFDPEGARENHSGPIIKLIARITGCGAARVSVIPPPTTTRGVAEDEGFRGTGDTAWSAQWSRRD